MKTKGIYALYRALQGLALPILMLYFLARGLRRGYWRSLPQRVGLLPRAFRQRGPGAIWLHAVSVGEVLSCVEFVRRLREQLPRSPVFVSTSTLAGYAAATTKLSGLAAGVFYAPVDYCFAVRRVLRCLKPSVVLIAETEIWPNLFREAKRTGAALALVNGRISDRALPRYLRFGWFFQCVLPQADLVLVQTAAIRDRFLALSAPPDRTRVSGNFKNDFEARPAAADSPVRKLLDRVKPDRVWIAASTMPPASSDDLDEDDVVIAAFRELVKRQPRLLLILVPRKPERFDVVARKLDQAGIVYVRRSRLDEGWTGTPQALLLDTIGELSGLFALADVVFMGGTLARRGGHNILEPALFGKPVVMGPHMENFQAIADEFKAARACVEIAGPAELEGAVWRLLDDVMAARETGERALDRAQASRGASLRAAVEVRTLHGTHLPVYRTPQPWLIPGLALRRIWIWGGHRRRDEGLRAQRKLDVPVISIGNLAMGGTGKTPCVLTLAELLTARGYHPGILTRGYKRGTPEDQLAVAPGTRGTAVQTGDEAQIFIRSGVAPVGIGVDRWEAGSLLRKHFAVNVMLLDDGFQHVRLARTLDVVLMDALDPLAGGGVFPMGRLREPLVELSRADVVVVTRSDFTDLSPAIEHTVRQWNPSAPVFRARVEPESWVEYRNGNEWRPVQRIEGRIAVFCGLGNPLSFRRTLEGLGIEPVDWLDFDDHHHYRPQELRRMAHQFTTRGVTAVVTTEKDAVNLCEGVGDLLAPLPLYWLKVRLKIDGEAEFLAEIERRLGHQLR